MAMSSQASAQAELPLEDLNGRSFALLAPRERERVGRLLRPLVWLDGLITAMVIAPDLVEAADEPDDDALIWLDMIWNDEHEAEIGNLTLEQCAAAVDPVMAHYAHVAETLSNDPESYRPYLADGGRARQAASQWAAGFWAGLSLDADAWAPLLQDRDALPLVIAILSLVPDADILEELRAESPFRGMPEVQRERMRQAAIEMLPDIIRSLHDAAATLDGSDDPALA